MAPFKYFCDKLGVGVCLQPVASGATSGSDFSCSRFGNPHKKE